MASGLLLGISDQILALGGGLVLASGVGGYAVHSVLQRRRAAASPDDVSDLRNTVAGMNQVALVVPESPSIDALAATVGLETLCKEWGVTASVFAEGEITGEDSKAFCNIFDLDVSIVAEDADALAECDGAIAVGGGGAIPTLGNGPRVVAVVRHRPAAAENILVIARTDDGATSTTVAHLLRQADVIPDQRVATALLYGIRAGTREFRRVRGQSDYQAASYLHDHADHGRIEALRAPGMSGETFDVIGDAIANRERQASFAVTNVGQVPSVSSLEEAADTLLRLDGVSSAAVFGVHDETIVVSCRAEDVRTNALDVLDSAFEERETVGGNADAGTARVPLGLFSQLDADYDETLDDLIDASTRKALFSAFETS
jgi:nanoRNase/pAp phosphatase (c-di-AMP/oligoRNAs hydrolase)